MENEKVIETFNKVKDIACVIFISFLAVLPLLSMIEPISEFYSENQYDLLKIIGFFGILLLALNLYVRYNNYKDKKEFYKDILPIFFFLLFMIWTFISSIFAKDTKLALMGTYYRKDGYISYILYGGCFSLSFGMCSKKMRKIYIYLFYLVSALMIVLMNLTRIFDLSNIISYLDYKTATFYNLNHYGYYLLIATAISSFLFISEKSKVLKIFNLLIYIYLLYWLIYNNTFGCYLALITTFIIYLIFAIIRKWKKRWILISIMIFILISFFGNGDVQRNVRENIIRSFSDSNNLMFKRQENSNWKNGGSGRIRLWIYGMKFFSERPILGYGPESLREKYEEVGIDQDRPHNLIIQLATTSGLPGLIFYLLAIRNYSS